MEYRSNDWWHPVGVQIVIAHWVPGFGEYASPPATLCATVGGNRVDNVSPRPHFPYVVHTIQPMKKRFTRIVFLLLFSVLLAGCKNHVKTEGKVVFEDDQTPLTCGVVILQNDTFQAKGEIQQDGTFKVGSFNKNDGLPPGSYRVYLSGAVSEPKTETYTEVDPAKMALRPPSVSRPNESVPLIDSKYNRADTSGITYDTKDGPILNITVQRPKKSEK